MRHEEVKLGKYHIPGSRYVMYVKNIAGGMVVWDGIYDNGYLTHEKHFLECLNGDKWEYTGEQI